MNTTSFEQDEMKERVEWLERELQYKCDTLDSYQDDLRECLEKEKDLKAKIDSLEAVSKLKDDMLRSCEKNFAYCEERILSLKAKIVRIETENEGLQMEINDLEAEL